MVRDEIKHAVSTTLREMFPGITIPDFSVEVSESAEHGDYATNAAFLLAKLAKKAPMEIAQFLVPQLMVDPFERVVASPPGFLNFWLTEEAFQKELKEIIKKNNKYGMGKKIQEKINLEFVSANPTGLLTLGNGRGGFYGDTLANVLEFAGFNVTREYYVNDGKVSTQIKELGKTGLGEGVTYLTPELKKVVKKLKKKIDALKKKQPKNIRGEAGYFIAQEIHKQNKIFLQKKAKINFNVFFSEERLYQKNDVDKLLALLKKKKLVYEKEGATWFESKKFGDSEDRVLVRSSGEPAYFLPDLAYHLNKFFARKFNRAIDIWGADHHGYAQRLSGALTALEVPAGKLKIIITQLVRLIRNGVEVKMSKRKGEFVTLEEVIDEVGVDAARFFFLMYSPDSHMDFDLELAKERSVKNPVYYVQYAHARIISIFKKAKKQKLGVADFSLLKEKEEVSLIKKLIQFPEAAEDAARDYQVMRLTRYAMELARSFHNFYEKNRVITEDKNLTATRLQLVKATQIVLQNVLALLGISAPEKM
ncbi:MAG: arginine--tRNA ligase [bacterium]|nr:arginine--tRNA ligase [bacterium]